MFKAHRTLAASDGFTPVFGRRGRLSAAPEHGPQVALTQKGRALHP